MPPTYTDAEAVAAYLARSGTVELPSDDAGGGDALIEEAESDIDRLLDAALVPDEKSGRKLNPESLSKWQAAALEVATAAQVEFLLLLGDEIVGDDSLRAAGPLSFGPTPRPPGPRVVELLAGHGLPWRSGTVKPAEDAEEEPA